MAVRRLVTLRPTNHRLDDVRDKTRYVLTRTRAKHLLPLLEAYPRESKSLVQDITYELEHGDDDTHIAFYIDDNDLDTVTALQFACLDYVFAFKKTERRP